MTRGRARRLALLLGLGAALGAALGTACNPATRRPAFGPVPAAPTIALRIPPATATTRLAERLRLDSVPVTEAYPRDGYLETPWFDAATGQPTEARRLGPDVVRVRAWADRAAITAGGVAHSSVAVEVVYRPLADPSLPERELERLVPAASPAAARVRRALDSLTARYGEPRPAPPPPAAPAARPGRQPADSLPAPADTTARPDSMRADSAGRYSLQPDSLPRDTAPRDTAQKRPPTRLPTKPIP